MPNFIVSGTGTRDHLKNKTVYIALTSASGGYPYWTADINSAQLFESAKIARENVSEDMLETARNVAVCRLEYSLFVVENVSPDTEKLLQQIQESHTRINNLNRQMAEHIQQSSEEVPNQAIITAIAATAQTLSAESKKLVDLQATLKRLQ